MARLNPRAAGLNPGAAFVLYTPPDVRDSPPPQHRSRNYHNSNACGNNFGEFVDILNTQYGQYGLYKDALAHVNRCAASRYAKFEEFQDNDYNHAQAIKITNFLADFLKDNKSKEKEHKPFTFSHNKNYDNSHADFSITNHIFSIAVEDMIYNTFPIPFRYNRRWPRVPVAAAAAAMPSKKPLSNFAREVHFKVLRDEREVHFKVLRDEIQALRQKQDELEQQLAAVGITLPPHNTNNQVAALEEQLVAMGQSFPRRSRTSRRSTPRRNVASAANATVATIAALHPSMFTSAREPAREPARGHLTRGHPRGHPRGH